MSLLSRLFRAETGLWRIKVTLVWAAVSVLQLQRSIQEQPFTSNTSSCTWSSPSFLPLLSRRCFLLFQVNDVFSSLFCGHQLCPMFSRCLTGEVVPCASKAYISHPGKVSLHLPRKVGIIIKFLWACWVVQLEISLFPGAKQQIYSQLRLRRTWPSIWKLY